MELYVNAGLSISECMLVKSPGLRCNQLSPVPEIDSAFVLDRTKCDPTKTKADKPPDLRKAEKQSGANV